MNDITRRAMLGALGAASLAGQRRSGTQPNIVVVLTDDQGYGDLACLGNPLVKTPNLDRLHGQSVRLTDYHVSPTCAPTRTALMTGCHEFKSGVTHTIYERERMSLKATTIAQILQRAGYATGIFGKWHLGDAEPYQPGKRGFDEVFIHGCGGIGQVYPGTCSDAPGNMYMDPVIRHNGVFEKTKGYCTDLLFGRGIEWMDEKRRTNSPFFAHIATNAPHTPLQCPERYQRMYDGLGLSENEQKYFGMVTNIDDNVGLLMGKLTEWNLEQNTLLIFMTDNGGTGGVRVFNAGMRGAKGTPWQGGTRVPAFFRWTGMLEPRDDNHLAAHIDLFPTLAEAAGVAIPSGLQLDGRSLLPVLKTGRTGWPNRYLFTHVGRWDRGQAANSKYRKCSIRDNRFSMVNIGPDKNWELYDVRVDPGEKTDLAKQHATLVKTMDAAYDKWWAEILPLLENENAVPPAVAPYTESYRKQFG
ncbi:MAG: arylsulfatase [Bryobacteraceae bacterium]|nr:arylsulfatase [Bryobacteraceae bacterium]